MKKKKPNKLASSLPIAYYSEITQQDARKKTTAKSKRLCVTNVTGLLIGSFDVVFPLVIITTA